MPNYVLAQESNRANIPDRLWYAMEETDLEDIAANENIATGDRVYVIKQGKTYIFGEDSEWYVSGKSSGGGGTSVDVEPLAVNANGTYTAAEGTAYSPVTVDVPSGGGGVKTVELTMRTTQNSIKLNAPIYDQEDDTYMPMSFMVDNQRVRICKSNNPTRAMIEKSSSQMYCTVLSGDATVTEGLGLFAIEISGDCTLNVDYSDN